MDNFLTDIEATLKQALENPANINLAGNPVPLVIVTPDPDFVELVLPCLTLQFTDIRKDLSRTENQRQEVIDLDLNQAKVKPASQAYNLYYSLIAHSDKLRDERLLLGQLIILLDANPIMQSQVLGKEFYLSREMSFNEQSKERDFAAALNVVLKIRVDAKEEQLLPIAVEMKINVGDVSAA